MSQIVKEEKVCEEHQTSATIPTEKFVDALARELNEMSLKEREFVYEEIHGVEEGTEEIPDFISEHLEALDVELRKISSKPAFDQADQNYVGSREFRLLFLRNDYYDGQKAAMQLVKFMEGMLEYFGPFLALTRPVYMSDLDSDDLSTLKSGVMQVLPARDRTGRMVGCDFMTMMPKCYKRPENVVSTYS
jgi:hypothetical protein